MGDRGNIIVTSNGGKNTVYLYSHWDGSNLHDVLKKALQRNQRWDDSFYLARIIFCTMIDGDVASETGYGISSIRGDGGRDITVDVDNQVIKDGNATPVSFENYIKA